MPQRRPRPSDESGPRRSTSPAFHYQNSPARDKARCYADDLDNLFDDLPCRLPAEQVTILVTAPGVRVERIVSTGHVTSPGEWLDQDADEWVVLLRGRARLRLDGDSDPLDLHPGHHILIRAHVRHRVEWTDDLGPTVWLAIHYHAGERPPD